MNQAMLFDEAIAEAKRMIEAKITDGISPVGVDLFLRGIGGGDITEAAKLAAFWQLVDEGALHVNISFTVQAGPMDERTENAFNALMLRLSDGLL